MDRNSSYFMMAMIIGVLVNSLGLLLASHDIIDGYVYLSLSVLFIGTGIWALRDINNENKKKEN